MSILAIVQAADMSWDKAIAALAGGGAATLLSVVLVLVLRRDDNREARLQKANEERDKIHATQHAECNSTIRTTTKQFADTIDTVTERSDDRFATAMREIRESHEKREERLLEILRNRTG